VEEPVGKEWGGACGGGACRAELGVEEPGGEEPGGEDGGGVWEGRSLAWRRREEPGARSLEGRSLGWRSLRGRSWEELGVEEGGGVWGEVIESCMDGVFPHTLHKYSTSSKLTLTWW